MYRERCFKMRKRIISLCLLLVAAMLCSCGGENVLTVKEDIVRMKIDESYTIKVEQEKDEILAWSSADTSIAIVSPEGTVSAVGNGITTVTACGEKAYVHVGIVVGGNNDYVDENGNVVQVFDGVSDITEITVGVRGGGKDDVTVKVGDSIQLRAYTVPSDSKDTIVWQSDDSSIARVDEEGKLQLISKGVTTITAYAPNGVNGKLIVRCK